MAVQPDSPKTRGFESRWNFLEANVVKMHRRDTRSMPIPTDSAAPTRASRTDESSFNSEALEFSNKNLIANSGDDWRMGMTNESVTRVGSRSAEAKTVWRPASRKRMQARWVFGPLMRV